MYMYITYMFMYSTYLQYLQYGGNVMNTCMYCIINNTNNNNFKQLDTHAHIVYVLYNVISLSPPQPTSYIYIRRVL